MLSTLVVTSLLSLGQAGPAVEKTIVIPGQAPIVQALFNPDGQRIYFATLAGVEGHDIDTGKRLFDVPYGRQLVCSPKGDLLAVVRIDIGMISIGGGVTVLDATTGKVLHQLTGTSAVFSPDSRWLISHSTYTWGHPDTDPPPKVQITDLRTGKTHLTQVSGAKGSEPALHKQSAGRIFHFTRDGKTLVSQSRNEFGQYKALAACDLETGKALERLPGNDELQPVREPSYSADGKRFTDGWKIFDVERGKATAKLESPKQATTDGWHPALQLSADGKRVFGFTSGRRPAALDDKTGRSTVTTVSHLHAWDADSGKWLETIADARRVVTAPTAIRKKLGGLHNSELLFAMNLQGTRAVDYSDDAVTVWDLTTGKAVRKLRSSGPSSRPEILRFSPDGKWIVAASTSGEAALWDTQTGEPVRTLDRAPHLGDVCFRPKSNELVGTGHGLIYIWDITTGELKRTLEQSGNLFQVACRPNGKLAALSDHWSDFITLVDLETGKTVHRLSGKGKSLAWHPDGGSLLSLDALGSLTLWDTVSAKKLQHWPGGKSGNYRYSAQRIAFLPGAARFLLCENDGVAIIDAATGKRLLEHPIKTKTRHELADADVHPEGKRFVVAFAGEHEIEERDIETGKVLRTFPGFPYGTSQARYSPDGSQLVTAGAYAYELRIHSAAAPAGVGAQPAQDGEWARVIEDDRAIKIETDKLEAVIPKKNPNQWMTGIEKGSFLDKTTGFREIGDGLMVVDWLMEPGSDAAWSDKLIAPDGNGVSRYRWYENETDPDRRSYALMAHGSSHRKRMIEGPQLCHRMKPVQPEVIRGKDFVAVRIT
jgi:WD40 repeat protein